MSLSMRILFLYFCIPIVKSESNTAAISNDVVPSPIPNQVVDKSLVDSPVSMMKSRSLVCMHFVKAQMSYITQDEKETKVLDQLLQELADRDLKTSTRTDSEKNSSDNHKPSVPAMSSSIAADRLQISMIADCVSDVQYLPNSVVKKLTIGEKMMQARSSSEENHELNEHSISTAKDSVSLGHTDSSTEIYDASTNVNSIAPDVNLISESDKEYTKAIAKLPDNDGYSFISIDMQSQFFFFWMEKIVQMRRWIPTNVNQIKGVSLLQWTLIQRLVYESQSDTLETITRRKQLQDQKYGIASDSENMRETLLSQSTMGMNIFGKSKPQYEYLYLIVVFVSMFGGAFWGLKKLIDTQHYSSPLISTEPSKKSSKSSKKKMK